MRRDLSNRTTSPPQTLDEFVEAFEAAKVAADESGSFIVNLLDYLPAEGDQLYQEVAAELVRVDMEHSWSRGENKRLDSYQALLPDVFRDQGILGEVAYEEYRLRAQAGEQVTAEQYYRKYGVPTDSWSRWDRFQQATTGDQPNGDQSPSSIPELWQEALQLAKDVPDFPAVGDSLTGFSLEEELGRGAFSHVFLARQAELAERQVVLKVAAGNSLEPQHLARLQHTNIVPIYSVHRQEKLTSVCMPYLGRRTLDDLLGVIRQEPDKIRSPQNLISTFLNLRDPTEVVPISRSSEPLEAATDPQAKVLDVLANSSYVDAVVWLVKQMAEGLAHAHQRGIVHRDLKPANVLLTDEGLPMLLDFNLSQEVVVNGRTSLLVGGTLPFMSPEQLRAITSGETIGCQADIFSLGVIFHELLTGERPFADHGGAFEDVVQEMLADRLSECPDLRTKNPAIPKSIEASVRRCLSADLGSRYRSANELVEDLGRHLKSEPLAHAPDRSPSERASKWVRRNPRLTSAGGVASVAMCIVGILFGLWVLRGNRLARLEAEEFLHSYQQNRPSLELALGLLHTDRQVLKDGIALTRKSLNDYHVLEDPNWRDNQKYLALRSEDRTWLNQNLTEELFLIARANERLWEAKEDDADRQELVQETLALNRQAVDLFSPAIPPQALLLQQSRLLKLLGQPDLTEELTKETKAPSKDYAIDQYDQVYNLITNHQYHQAESSLTSLRDRDPDDPLAWLLLGNTKLALDKIHEAEGCYTTAISFEPESYLGYLQRGYSRLNRGQYDDARKDFDQVIALRPRLACGYLNRALSYRALRKFPAAIDDLTKAIELGTPQTRAYFLRSDLRKLIGDAVGAEADRQIGLKLIPTDEQSWISRGYAKLNTNPEAALEDYQEALELNPSSRSALLKMVNVLADHLSQPDEAIELVNQMLTSNEQDTDALASRAILQARMNQRDAALADVQRLLQLSRSPQMLFQAACALSLTSRSEESDAAKALTLLSQAVQVAPVWFVRAHTDPDLEPLRETEAFQAFATNTRKINRMRINLAKPSADGQSK